MALAPARASGSEPDSGKHYIWRITNAPAPFYLGGSVHSLSGKDYPPAKAIMDAFHEAKCVVFEFNPNADDEFSEKFEKASKLPKGQKIYSRLHPQTLAFLKKRFWISSLNFAQVEDWKAWRIASIWGIRGWSNASGDYGLDNYLSYHCRRLGKAMGGMETVDEHVAVLGDMSDVEGEVLLSTTLCRATNDAIATTRPWRRGNTETSRAPGRENGDSERRLPRFLRACLICVT